MVDNKIDSKKTIGNITKVLVSNLLKLFAGILVGFLLPKIIGVTDYGYYKTFTLYATYVGLFHFGFIDGIYLKYGGKNIDELNKGTFRFYSVILFSLEIFISIILALVAFFALKGEMRFIFLCLAAFVFASNIITYYQTISQITNRFNEYSLRTIIQSLLIIVSIVSLWIVHKYSDSIESYRIYTCIYISIFVLLALWYVFTYRDLSFGKIEKHKLKEPVNLIKLGFPLLIANLCSTIILAADRQFVNLFFDKDTYAVYAFAYNLLGLVTVALSAISTVIYPTLKRTKTEDLKSVYPKAETIILILSFACLILYFPLKVFIPWFLPKYNGSLEIFRIIFPGIFIFAFY